MLKKTPILIIGNAAHDILINQNGEIVKCLGGSAPYISKVFSGLNIPYNVVSHVGHDFKYLYNCPFFPSFLKTSSTTTFINFNSIPRVQKVIKCCKPIFPKEIKYFSDIAVVCGIIGEVPPVTIKKIRSNSKILIADIQGFIRKRQKDGSVILSHIDDTLYSKSIFLFDFIKVSEEEIEYIDLTKLVRGGVKVLVTRADNGCHLYYQNSSIHIPTFSIKPVDSTGAGDSFLAGFVAGLYNNISIQNSIELGHKCASIAIKFIGIPNKEQFITLKF